MNEDGEIAHLVIRKPLTSIENEIRKKFAITSPLVDVAVEHDALVMTFQGGPYSKVNASERHTAQPDSTPDSVDTSAGRIRKRSKLRVRNRMRTRGWQIVDKFVNSHGQSCSIYKPILDAIKVKGARRRESYTAVRQLLIANGNDPGPSSVEYFLDNHLEYLKKQDDKQPPGG